MDPWALRLHELGTIIAAIAAAIAAVSSLKNGQILKNGQTGHSEVGRLEKKRSRSKTPKDGSKPDDWYKPPNLE